MSEIIDVKIGRALPPDRWIAAADNLQTVFPTIAERLRLMNRDNRGEEDARAFMNDAMLAVVALRYVGNGASEQCRFLAIPNGDGGEG